MNKTPTIVLGLLTLAACTALSSCTADSYRQSADRQVRQIVRQRQDQTLAYRPQVEVSPATPAAPTTQAYTKIPTTPIPPVAPSPMEFPARELPYVPAGPPANQVQGGIDAPGRQSLADLGLRQTPDSLRLGPPLPGTLVRRFDLFRSLEYAVQHSRSYQSEMEDVYLAALDVTLQRHLFEPRPFVQTGLTVNGGGEDVRFRSALNATTTAGIRQRLPYGGEVVAKTMVGFVQALSDQANNGESAQVALSGTLPLLRGAGLVNLEGLINSERQLVYRIREFEDYRRDFVVTIATQYFRLISSLQNVANRRANYTSQINLTERTLALYAANRLRFDDVQRAYQSQLQAENNLANSESAYQTQLDNFKVTMGMPLSDALVIVPEELEVELPQVGSEDAVRLAIQYRLDLQTARDQIEDGRRAVKVAENGLLPNLDLSGDVSMGNRSTDPARAVRNDTLDYNAGVLLDLPIDRLAERNAYRRSLVQFYRAQRSYDEQRDRVSVSARDALRGISTSQTTLRIQRQGINLAQQRLDLVNERLKVGEVNLEAVQNAQDSLLQAQDAYEQARAQLQINLLQYLRQTGTLRLDPEAGAIGRALDRQAGEMNKTVDARY